MSSQVPPFRLCIDYVLGTVPNIFDLSGHTPFTLSVDIARPRGHAQQHPEAHSSFIDVIINGSVLDVSDALQAGQLSLVEAEGAYPDTKWRDCVRRDLPKDVFHEQHPGPDLEAPKVVRINPGQLAKPTDPQCLESSLNPAIVSVLKDQHLYTFKYPPAPPDGQAWDGGISWWKLCSDPSRPPDISAPTDQPHAKVRRTTLPIFKAMANPPRPPHIDYELEMVPSVLSLKNTQAIKLKLKVCLREEIPYTVMAHKAKARGPGGTALVESRIDARNFDVFDLDTGVTISGRPRYATSMWSAGLSRAPMYREQLREMTPDQIYTAEFELRDDNDLSKRFAESLRIDDIGALSGHRLGVRLRPVQTFWSTKGIDKLFGEAETVRREYWYIPLVVASPAVAEFSVEA